MDLCRVWFGTLLVAGTLGGCSDGAARIGDADTDTDTALPTYDALPRCELSETWTLPAGGDIGVIEPDYCYGPTFPLLFTYLYVSTPHGFILETCWRVLDAAPETGWHVGDVVRGQPSSRHFEHLVAEYGAPVTWEVLALTSSGLLQRGTGASALLHSPRVVTVSEEEVLAITGEYHYPVYATPTRIVFDDHLIVRESVADGPIWIQNMIFTWIHQAETPELVVANVESSPPDRQAIPLPAGSGPFLLAARHLSGGDHATHVVAAQGAVATVVEVISDYASREVALGEVRTIDLGAAPDEIRLFANSNLDAEALLARFGEELRAWNLATGEPIAVGPEVGAVEKFTPGSGNFFRGSALFSLFPQSRYPAEPVFTSTRVADFASEDLLLAGEVLAVFHQASTRPSQTLIFGRDGIAASLGVPGPTFVDAVDAFGGPITAAARVETDWRKILFATDLDARGYHLLFAEWPEAGCY